MATYLEYGFLKESLPPPSVHERSPIYKSLTASVQCTDLSAVCKIGIICQSRSAFADFSDKIEDVIGHRLVRGAVIGHTAENIVREVLYKTIWTCDRGEDVT